MAWMVSTWQFVIEAACWTGVILLAPLAASAFGPKWDWFRWLSLAILDVSFIILFFVSPSDLFPGVVGVTLYIGAVVGSLLGARAGWRFVRRGHQGRLGALAATHFGAMVSYLVAAAPLLISGVLAYSELQKGEEAAYQRAPICATAPSTDCRSQTEAIVVRTWAERAEGPRHIEVSANGRNETIKIQTAWDVWQTLTEGEGVQLTSWRGKVTEVTVPDVGVMQTENAPSSNALILKAVGGIFFVGGLGFACRGIAYGYKCWAANRGDDMGDRAA